MPASISGRRVEHLRDILDSCWIEVRGRSVIDSHAVADGQLVALAQRHPHALARPDDALEAGSERDRREPGQSAG